MAETAHVTHRRHRRLCGVVAVAAVVSTATGCGSADTVSEVADVATRFHAALSHDDGAAACALLAPQTAGELEQSAQQPCPRAVLGEDLPPAGGVRTSRVFGTQGQVMLTGDTVFLAEFPDGWKVVAAGCTAREALPYDCLIKGL